MIGLQGIKAFLSKRGWSNSFWCTPTFAFNSYSCLKLQLAYLVNWVEKIIMEGFQMAPLLSSTSLSGEIYVIISTRMVEH